MPSRASCRSRWLVALMLIDFSNYTLSIESLQILNITGATPPVWHLSYSHRLMTSKDTLDYVMDHNPAEVFRMPLNMSMRIPWDKLSTKTLLLIFQCTNGYDNEHSLTEIKQGFVGRHLRLLKYLEITGCVLEEVSAETFQGLTRLVTLSIESKYLLHLPLGVFQPLRNIMWIRLNNCNIESISNYLFCENSKLTFLSLTNNSIRDIVATKIRNTHCKIGAINSFVVDGNILGDLNNANFEPYNLIGILSLVNCSINSISRVSFDGLSDVVTIDMEGNSIRHIPDYAFTALNKSLAYMNFAYNQLKHIDVSKTFAGLKLETLNIYNNFISSITGKLSDMKYLEVLDLQNNLLHEVKAETFGNLTSLKVLDLSNNSIEHIEEGTFDNYVNLNKLRMEQNKVKHLPKGIFDDAISLSGLYIHANDIETLDETIFEKCKMLKRLEIQNNRLIKISRLSFTSDVLEFIRLEYNNLSVLPVLTRPTSNTCYNFPHLNQLKARHNAVTNIDTICFKELRNLDLSYNRLKQINNFGVLNKLEKLFLRDNIISALPRNVMHGLCANMVMLDVGRNILQKIESNVFSNCHNLQILKLDHNKLKMFEPLRLASFNDIRLARNPLECGCVNEALIIWLNYSSSVSVDDATCDTGDILAYFKMANCNAVYMNWTSLILKVAIPTASIILMAAVIVFIIFKFRYEIQVIAFYKWNIRFSCCCLKKSEESVDYKYDAFVCFAEEDVSFVTGTLLPLLEPKHNICIYYRDFPIGEDIAEAILDVINTSAVIIILLSENFMNSRWGTFEFRNAHYSAIRNKGKRMLIIILNDSVLNMKLDLTLRSILYTKSYLKAEDKLFKEKLLHSMPEMPVGNKESPIEEHVSCIDTAEEPSTVKTSRTSNYKYIDVIELNDIYDTIQL